VPHLNPRIRKTLRGFQLARHRNCTLRNSLGSELAPIHTRAGKREKQMSRLNTPGVVLKPRYFSFSKLRRYFRQDRNPRQQLA